MTAPPASLPVDLALESIVIHADSLADELLWEEEPDRDYMLELIHRIIKDAKRATL